MATDTEKQWKCSECNEISLETALLIAPNPFDETDTIGGCPLCLAVEGFTEICDETGCEGQATCGYPTKDGSHGGYRRTCWRHYDRNPANATVTPNENGPDAS